MWQSDLTTRWRNQKVQDDLPPAHLPNWRTLNHLCELCIITTLRVTHAEVHANDLSQAMIGEVMTLVGGF